MKNFKLLLLSSLLVIGVSTQASPAAVEKEVQIGIGDVYVPGGFDSNSSAFVVANGYFPNSCYRWNRSEVKHIDTFTHEVKSIASVSQGMCLMVMVPFTKEVSLGKFESGKHTLRFLNGDGTYLEKSMSIE
ncbi:MAG TPA: hypothetical protein VIG33_08240 [Pseudobdellovibrionaceae bacterium]